MSFLESENLKLFLFVFLLLSGNNTLVSAKEAECSLLLIEKVESYRHYILSGDTESLFRQVSYPVMAWIGSKPRPVRNTRDLNIFWEFIATERFLDLVRESSSCDLVRELNIEPDSYKIRSLAIFYDEEDSEYSYSGITSKRALLRFLRGVLELSTNKDYEQLSTLFRYPFMIRCSGEKITIKNQQQFLKHADNIIDDNFMKIITTAQDEKNLVQHPKGLMLNEIGEIWILEVYGSGKLLLQLVNI